MSALLEIRNLEGGYEKGVHILQGIDLTVDQGEAVGIIGLNGSGKSTLGKAIMNLLPYRKGSIVFDGQQVDDRPPHELVQMGIALMHQGGVVFPNLSVWQNLTLATGGNSQRSIVNSQLQEVIPLLQKSKRELIRTMADKLSGGQRHELALAMTLARKPKLVILDEPSAGLSPKAVEEMYEMLDVIHKSFEMSIVLIEQNISHALSSCDRCVMLSQGVISCEFTGKDLLISEIERIMFKN